MRKSKKRTAARRRAKRKIPKPAPLTWVAFAPSGRPGSVAVALTSPFHTEAVRTSDGRYFMTVEAPDRESARAVAIARFTAINDASPQPQEPTESIYKGWVLLIADMIGSPTNAGRGIIDIMRETAAKLTATLDAIRNIPNRFPPPSPWDD